MNTINFIEDKHLYLLNNRLVPSVSQIVEFMFPMYDDIPQEVLKKAADYGTLGHNILEAYLEGEYSTKDLLELNIPITLKQSIYDGLRASKKELNDIKGSEINVGYKNRYAGRLDILCEHRIVDLKFTSKLYLDKLRWQLSLYKYAYEDTYEDTIDRIGYLWLPKNKLVEYGELEIVPLEECLKAVEEYEKYFTRQ